MRGLLPSRANSLGKRLPAGGGLCEFLGRGAIGVVTRTPMIRRSMRSGVRSPVRGIAGRPQGSGRRRDLEPLGSPPHRPAVVHHAPGQHQQSLRSQKIIKMGQEGDLRV